MVRSALPALPHRLHKIQKGQQGLEIGQTLGYWTPKQFLRNKFLDVIIVC